MIIYKAATTNSKNFYFSVTQIFITKGYTGDKITVYLVMRSPVYKNTRVMIPPHIN